MSTKLAEWSIKFTSREYRYITPLRIPFLLNTNAEITLYNQVIALYNYKEFPSNPRSSFAPQGARNALVSHPFDVACHIGFDGYTMCADSRGHPTDFYVEGST